MEEKNMKKSTIAKVLTIGVAAVCFVCLFLNQANQSKQIADLRDENFLLESSCAEFKNSTSELAEKIAEIKEKSVSKDNVYDYAVTKTIFVEGGQCVIPKGDYGTVVHVENLTIDPSNGKNADVDRVYKLINKSEYGIAIITGPDAGVELVLVEPTQAQ